MSRPMVRCHCPQCVGDRWANPIAWAAVAVIVIVCAAFRVGAL